MTKVLKKNSFLWCEEAQFSFETLKSAIISTPVLAFPNFEKDFIVEIDACSVGIGAILSRIITQSLIITANLWEG